MLFLRIDSYIFYVYFQKALFHNKKNKTLAMFEIITIFSGFLSFRAFTELVSKKYHQ